MYIKKNMLMGSYNMGYTKGKNVVIKEGTIIGDNVIIEDDVYIDCYCIIRDNVIIKKGSYIGSRCILGEYTPDFYKKRKNGYHPLIIEENSVITSGAIIYGDTEIESKFYAGQNVTIRENCKIHNDVNIGIKSDIQHHCEIGKCTNIDGACFVGEESKIEDFVKISFGVILTNDPTPPSENLLGVTLKKFSKVLNGSILLPGVKVGSKSVVVDGSVVTKNVKSNTFVKGHPAKVVERY